VSDSTNPVTESPIAIASPDTTAMSRPANADVNREQSAWRRLIPLAMLAIDFVAISLAFYTAWYIRYVMQIGGDVDPGDYVDYSVYAPLQLVLAAFLPIHFAFARLYRLPMASIVDIGVAVVYSASFSAILLYAGTAMLRYPASSRFTFFYVWALAIVAVLIGRALLGSLMGVLHRRGFAIERVLIVGDTNRGRMVMQGLAAQRNRGYQVVGFLGETAGEDFGRFRSLGTIEQLARVVEDYEVSQVIVALPPALHEKVLPTLDECRRGGLTFKVIPDLYEMRLSLVDTDTVLGIPLIGLREVSIEGWNQVVKRAIDVVVSSLAVLVASPFMAAIAIVIKLESPGGPVIFRHTRIGKDGEPFTMFKFRSMTPNAADERPSLESQNEAIGPLFKIRHDPRLTRVGGFIRKFSMDEIPQLINVLRGDMSLVGPRPPIPSEVEQYEEWHKKRLAVSPGMTGLWQVSGRSELDFDEMVMYDIYYIEHWSLSLDFRILLRTIPTVLCGGGAF
jgi:exopolysaccharide biosynthesis polyprenyl glycosylphosphotransferase